MAVARVVTFSGVSSERMQEMQREMESQERPEGVPATEIVVLHDPDAEESLVVLLFESEDDYRQGDELTVNVSVRCHPPRSRKLAHASALLGPRNAMLNRPAPRPSASTQSQPARPARR